MNAPAVEVPVRVPWVGPVTRAAVRVSPVGVGVVAQRPGRGDGQRGAFGGGVGVIDRGRGVVVGAGDGDGDGGDIAGEPAGVGDGVGEGVGAGEVGVGGVGERAGGGGAGQGAVGRAGDQGRGQGVAGSGSVSLPSGPGAGTASGAPSAVV